MLDLGCGPGQLAVAFARLGCAVTAMDPEPDMLAAAAKEAAASGVSVNLVEGSSYDLSAGCGPFHLVVMGRSFHWMDRAATLCSTRSSRRTGPSFFSVTDVLRPPERIGPPCCTSSAGRRWAAQVAGLRPACGLGTAPKLSPRFHRPGGEALNNSCRPGRCWQRAMKRPHSSCRWRQT